MRALRRFLIRLARTMMRRRDEERVREEIQAHLTLQTAEHVRAGLSPSEARRQALLKFGGVESVRADYWDEQGLPSLDRLGYDLRYTLRQLRRAPSFTITAALTLALGIGITTGIGLRMALGAAPGRVRGMVLRQVAVMTAVGGLLGLIGALALGRTAEALLFELEGHDPMVLTAAALTLTLVALGAGFIPAHRASRIDPMRALRYE